MEDLGDERIKLSPDEVNDAYNLYMVAREWNMPDIMMLDSFKLLGLLLLNGTRDQGDSVEIGKELIPVFKHTLTVGAKLGEIASQLQTSLYLIDNPATEDVGPIV